MNLSALISTYIPSNYVAEKKRVMFETLFKILQRSDIEPSLRIPLVDNLFAFVSEKSHIDISLKWHETGVISNEQGEELFKLSAKHKQSIVKIVFADISYPVEFKNELINKTLGDDKSDIAENLRAACDALLPDADSKRKTWEIITDVESKESIYKR